MTEQTEAVSTAESPPPRAEPTDGAGGAAGMVAAVFLAVIVIAALFGLGRSVMRNRFSRSVDEGSPSSAAD